MKKIVIALAAMVISSTALAGAPWTYVDLGYITGDSGNERTDGFGLRGSWGFVNIFHAGAGVASIDTLGGKGKPQGTDNSRYDIFIGLHPGITDNVDLVADIGYQSTEVDNGSTKDDVTAVFLRGGPRGLWNDKFEASLYLIGEWGEDKTLTPKQDFTSVGLQVGLQWYFSPAWSIGADAIMNGGGQGTNTTSDDEVNLFVRWSFPGVR